MFSGSSGTLPDAFPEKYAIYFCANLNIYRYPTQALGCGVVSD
jgi:hypothetical protein